MNVNEQKPLLVGSRMRYGSDYPDSLLLQKQSNYLSLGIIGLCVLIGDMSRGIYFPTRYLNVMRYGGDKVTAGISVASMSAGRILISPFFGKLSEDIRHRRTLMISLSILCFGTVVYAQAHSVLEIIIGQFIVGIGSGTFGVTRSYVAETTEQKYRTECMAYLTTMQYIGFAVMPFIGSLLTDYGTSKPGNLFYLFPINEYTLPAYFTIACILLTLMLLYFVFKDYEIDEEQARPRVRIGRIKEQAYVETQAGDVNYMLADSNTNVLSAPIQRCTACVSNLTLSDKLAIGGCLLNMTTKGTIAVYETLGVSFVEHELDWNNVRAGVVFAAGGVGGVMSLLSFKWFVETFGDLKLIVYGLVGMTLSLILMVDWGIPMQEWRLILAVFFMYSTGYPISHTAELGMYSKIVAKGPQGRIQGWFGSAGSSGRIVYPIMAGILTEYVNSSAIFIVAALGLVLSTIIVVKFEDKINSILYS